MTTNTLYKHIVVNDQGVLLIEGTTMKVMELILNYKAYKWTPEEVQKNHPYLTLGQIYSVLAYYWDYKEVIDQEIENRLQRVDELQSTLNPSRMRKRIEAEDAN